MRSTKCKRSFVPGDEWLYYKLYAGPKTCDDILINILKPLLSDFFREGVIKKWFFIRFCDPDNHLRVRFLLSKDEYCAVIMQKLQKALGNYIDEDLVWKIQIDTYQRELKRYGLENIIYAESLFSIESNMVVDLLLGMKADDQLRWGITILMIDELLNCFSFSLENKNKLLIELKEGYSVEFGLNKGLKIHLDGKFRKERKYLSKLLENVDMGDEQFLLYKERIKLAVEELIPIAGQIIQKNEQNHLHVDFHDLIKSFIHMLCNRCLLAKLRKQELIIYYFLSRYYQSLLARMKQKGKIVKEN